MAVLPLHTGFQRGIIYAIAREELVLDIASFFSGFNGDFLGRVAALFAVLEANGPVGVPLSNAGQRANNKDLLVTVWIELA